MMHVLDMDPAVAVTYLCDSHVESGSHNTLRYLAIAAELLGIEGSPWKAGRLSEWAGLWASKSRWSWNYTLAYARACSQESMRRRGTVSKRGIMLAWAGSVDVENIDFDLPDPVMMNTFPPTYDRKYVRNPDGTRRSTVEATRIWYHDYEAIMARKVRVFKALSRMVDGRVPAGSHPRYMTWTGRPVPFFMAEERPSPTLSEEQLDILSRWMADNRPEVSGMKPVRGESLIDRLMDDEEAMRQVLSIVG